MHHHGNVGNITQAYPKRMNDAGALFLDAYRIRHELQYFH